MTPPRWILHADMDAFFASVEERDHPELRGRPVIVGGTSNRGVVSAASYEARRFGVRSAMPTFKAKALCPHGIFLPGDMKKYAQASREIHEVFHEFTNQIEPLALDEAFLDISGSLRLLGAPEQVANRLKQRVWSKTQLKVSVGVAPNKLVAKIACGLSKPDGLKLVHPEQVRELLAPLPVRKLWGVGPKTEERLVALGIRTFDDISRASPRLLSQVFGRCGEEMRARARGVDDRPVETERDTKSISEEATFADNVGDRTRLFDALVVHAEAVAARARRSGYVGSIVTLKVKFAERRSGKATSVHELFESLSRQRSLSGPTADGRTIFEAARSLLEQIGKEKAVRLIGLGLSGLGHRDAPEQSGLQPQVAAPTQLELAFLQKELASSLGVAPAPEAVTKQAEATRRVRPELGPVLDLVNDKFGMGTLRRAVDKQEKLSPHDKVKMGETP